MFYVYHLRLLNNERMKSSIVIGHIVIINILSGLLIGLDVFVINAKRSTDATIVTPIAIYSKIALNISI